MHARTTGAATNGTASTGLYATGRPNSTGSLTLTRDGRIVAGANVRSRGTRLRSSSTTSGSVAPAPPGNTNRNVATTTTCGIGSWCTNAYVLSACSRGTTGNTTPPGSA